MLDGTRPEQSFCDWIELHNRGSKAVSLLGWSLTDDESNKRKWVLPEVELMAGGYLVVLCTGLDRRDAAAGFCAVNDIGVVVESLRRRHRVRPV